MPNSFQGDTASGFAAGAARCKTADLLQGKLWAFQDQTRRASKRYKDLVEIAQLVDAFPKLRADVPPEIPAQLIL